MMAASNPDPAMMMNPCRRTSPASSVQKSSPMSTWAVRPSRHALASAAASGALPMLLKKRLAVPEGKMSAGTCVSRRLSRTLETVPSPPEMTTRSKARTSATASSGSMPSPMNRMQISSPPIERAREREDLVGARAGREVVDDEDAHVFPVRAKPSIVIVSTILPSARGAANHHG